MDIKAMAKSKRSHTRHNQPRKHVNLPKTPAPSSSSSSSSSSASAVSGDPKLGNQQVRDRKRTVHHPSLPSNWDRYEDDVSDDGEQVSQLSFDSSTDDSKAKSAPDVVKPKSKGANFGDLIAQAKESRSSFAPSLDDALPDFYQGLGPMLSVRGESVLSLEGDDFLADEEATTTQEAPFLRLDLQDLAEQLAKVDLAERLFIEPDILPQELRAEWVNDSDSQTFLWKSQKQKRAQVLETFDELLSLYLEDERNSEREKYGDKEVTKASSAGTSSSCLDPASTAHVTDSKLDARETSSATRVSEKDPKPSSTFEAAAAEAELDILLNSFSDTTLLDSSATGTEVTTSKNHTTPLLSSENPVDIPITSSLDDDIDSLLEQTSKQDDIGSLAQQVEVKATLFEHPSSTPSLEPSLKSKALDDFDSWFDMI